MPTPPPVTCSLKHENLCATAYCCRCAALLLSESHRLSFGILFPPSRMLSRFASRSLSRSDIPIPPIPTTIRIQKKMSLLDPFMFIEGLPVEIMADILSRLPVKTIIQCKCVCKKWRSIVLDSYFANLQLSRSPTSVMIHHNRKKYRNSEKTGILRWTEVEDEIDHHHLHHDPVMSLDLDLSPIFQKSQILLVGSVNGLLCLWKFGPRKEKTYICNPITREYMILPKPHYCRKSVATIVHCFGFSSLTREYKVIQIFKGDIHIPPNPTSKSRSSLIEVEVYTLGTGQWRSIGHVPYWLQGFYGPFLNGHAHWTILDNDSPEQICAFDFDNETFDLFPSPPSEAIAETRMHKTLGVLKGCLCQCECYDDNWTVWMMKEYGIKKSWHKELVIMNENISPNLDLLTSELMHLIAGLKDGTIVMQSYRDTLFFYCPRRKTIVDAEVFEYFFNAYGYRPSFHRLQNFENEKVGLF